MEILAKSAKFHNANSSGLNEIRPFGLSKIDPNIKN